MRACYYFIITYCLLLLDRLKAELEKELTQEKERCNQWERRLAKAQMVEQRIDQSTCNKKTVIQLNISSSLRGKKGSGWLHVPQREHEVKHLGFPGKSRSFQSSELSACVCCTEIDNFLLKS